MISLKNVSKFYYQKGMVTSGFSKVNLELNMGEFVAITGESGSGKSTLLNVISGLDSYEEGEMLINCEETSAYTEADFENYRRKYIANIFQSFNLVNSYTVYQNVELVMLINGFKKREIKARVMKVLKRVGLYKYRNTKASKLSGGQKQRVAIARALVKDTPIIVADEPTGNLDSKSAESIVQLLSKISKNKLVIIVTHNYEQIEPYVSRKITMHDGKVTDDRVLAPGGEAIESGEAKNYKKMRPTSKLRLSLRNTFNVAAKFLLLLFIFLFISFAVTSFYASLRKQSYDQSNLGYNNYFADHSDKRIVIKKEDLSAFTEEDYEKIKQLNNINYIVENDLLLDKYIFLSSDNYYFYGNLKGIELLEGELSAGRMPEAPEEVVIYANKDDYNFKNSTEDILQTEFSLNNDATGQQMVSYKVKIVGVVLTDDQSYNYNYIIYAQDELLAEVRKSINSDYSTVKTYAAGHEFTQEQYSMMNKVVPSYVVPQARAIVSADWDMYYQNNECIGNPISISISNIYFSDSLNLTIINNYTKDNFTSLMGLNKDDFDWNNGAIYVNPADYQALFDKPNYQSSVFIKDTELVRETIDELKQMGLNPLYVKDVLVSYSGSWDVINNALQVVWSSILMIALFFIAYFIIKLILKSRNVYFSTIRMLGASKSDASWLIILELFTVLNVAFILLMGLMYTVYSGYINISYINDMLRYLKLSDYMLLYGVLLIMSLLISLRYSRQLFKNTAMNTYKEEL